MIVKHLGIALGIAVAYALLRHTVSPPPAFLPWVFVFLPPLNMGVFRWYRDWRGLPWREAAPRKIRVAIDMDGVLVEQVVPVLEKLRSETGIDLSKHDITDWQYTFADTNIKAEIEKAERDPEFARNMPPIPHSPEAFRLLSSRFDVMVATSREEITDPWSRDWLAAHSMSICGLVNTRRQGKALPGVDILIDDYVENIREFLEKGPETRKAILFAQPWNRDTEAIGMWIESGRVHVAHSWHTVLALLDNALPAAGPSDADTHRPDPGDDTVRRDYFAMQALSCFLAGFLFLRAMALVGEGTSLFLGAFDWLLLPFATAFLVLAFFYIAAALSQHLQRMAMRALSLSAFPISVASLSGVVIAYLDGAQAVVDRGPWAHLFFVAGFVFILTYGVHFVLSSYRHSRLWRRRASAS